MFFRKNLKDAEIIGLHFGTADPVFWSTRFKPSYAAL